MGLGVSMNMVANSLVGLGKIDETIAHLHNTKMHYKNIIYIYENIYIYSQILTSKINI